MGVDGVNVHRVGVPGGPHRPPNLRRKRVKHLAGEDWPFLGLNFGGLSRHRGGVWFIIIIFRVIYRHLGNRRFRRTG